MDDPRFEFVLFPNVGQWVKLIDWDYSAVKIYEVDYVCKQFKARFLTPPKLGVSSLEYPEIDETRWIPFEKIRTSLRKFWQKEIIILHEQGLIHEKGLSIGSWVVYSKNESPGKVTSIKKDLFKACFFGEDNDDGTSCTEDDQDWKKISLIEEVIIRPDKIEILDKALVWDSM